MARVNPFRFSTKYQDDETDLLYYGYRYYNASTGRWVSRDRIQEKGGGNLYGFTGNDPVRNADRRGNDFTWTVPDYNPNGVAIRQRDWVQTGGTSWKHFEPKVNIWKRDGCCYGLNFSGNYAQVHSWWVKGDIASMMHEMNHIVSHFRPAFDGYKAEATAYFAPCKRKGEAECLKAAIEGPLAEAWKEYAFMVALAWDCQVYGYEACQEAQSSAQDYQTKNETAHRELSRCSSLD